MELTVSGAIASMMAPTNDLQYSLKRLRCQRMIVSGFTKMSASFHPVQVFARRLQRIRSAGPSSPKVKQTLNNWLDLIGNGTAKKTGSVTTLLDRIGEGEERRKELEQGLMESGLQEGEFKKRILDAEITRDSLARFRDLFDETQKEEKKFLLQLMIARIVWTPEEIEIALYDRPTDTGRLSSNSSVNREGDISLEIANWLRASERFTNFFDLTFWIDLSRLHKGEFFVSPIEPAGTEPTATHKEATMPVVIPVKQALFLKELLEQGACTSRADLARHLGMSKARVTQTLNLLKLAPDILDVLLNLPDDQVRLFSERRLRPITKILSPKKQTAAFIEMCAEFPTKID